MDWALAAATGSVILTVSPPPGVSAATIAPPMASVKPLATARPSPTPTCARRSAGTARRSAPSARPGRRGPWSTTSSTTRSPAPVGLQRRAARPGGEWSSALENRFASTRSSRPGSARTIGMPSGTSIRRSAGASRPRSATGATSSIVIGAQERLQRAGVQAAHVEQVADQPVEPVGVLLDGGEQRLFVGLGPGHVGLAQAADAGLDRGQRRAQVVADRGEQRGPHPVALGQRLGLGGLGAQPFPVEGGGGLRREAGQQARRERGAAGRSPQAPGRCGRRRG